jgi:1,4-dihydroxy-2-naphthoyl-CoA hydrolase
MIVAQEVLDLYGVKDKAVFAEQMRSRIENTLIGTLEIEYVELTQDRVVMTMPVGPKTWQPAGILHGGASVALAETAASIATAINTDLRKFNPVGMEINANHIRSKRDGVVTATATPFHKGRTTMIWDIKITDEAGKLICISRCTMAVVEKKNNEG